MARIGIDDATCLMLEDARKDHRRALAGDAAHGRRQRHQRTGQNVGDDEVIGRALGDGWVIDPSGLERDDVFAHAIPGGILDRGGDRDRVDVAGDHGCPRALSQGDGKDAGAGADIEHAAGTPALKNAVNGFKATGGGLVVARAECLGRINAHRRQAMWHGTGFVAAIDIEAAGRDRGQTFERSGNPVDLGIDG